MLVVGDDDVEHGTVGVNARGAATQPERGVPLDDVRRAARRRGRRRATGRRVTLERLWAGWRATYIDERRDATAPPDDDECLFWRLRRDDPTTRRSCSRATTHAFAVMNAYPYTSGHLMVAPAAPRGDARRARRATRPPR